MSKLFADAVVIGGGVCGTAITYYLSRAGLKPILAEQGYLNSGASGACDEGIILISKNPGIAMDMAVKSAELYKKLQNELSADFAYQNVGGMILIDEEKYIPIIQSFVNRQQKQGLNISMLNQSDTHRQQPGLSKKVVAGAFSKDDCSICPFKLTSAYVNTAQKLGAGILLHHSVTGIETEKNHQKIASVTTAEHKIITPIVIDASGCSSAHIGKFVGLTVPVFPMRGQLVITEKVPPLVVHQLMDAKYIAAKHQPQLMNKYSSNGNLNIGLTLGQAKTGNLIIGGCREKVDFNTDIAYLTIREIVKNAVSFLPILKDISIIRTFAGLRPSTPDNHPIISATPISGFFIASGMGGDGVSLSPVVGKIMAELVVKNHCSIVDMEQLRLDRFCEK